MKIDIRRGLINAANSILEGGLDRYVSDGIRFGFFDEKDKPKELLQNIINQLEDLSELELANKLKSLV